MKIVVAGHVDHGKSTLIGRLLRDTNSLTEGREEELTQLCNKRGTELEWAFLLDSFQTERDQNVTIDTTQVTFKTDKRAYTLIDAPGHVEFLRGMVSGAAQADAALLLVDVNEGIREQTRRHAALLATLGIKQIVVIVNKMDSVGYNREIFARVADQIRDELKLTHIIPLSARHGKMLLTRGTTMKWYKGKTLVETLDAFTAPERPLDKPLRFTVQDIYRMEGKRIIVGRVDSGILRTGDQLLFSPYNQQANVQSIETWPHQNKTEALAGECIGITLDEQIFTDRGSVASHDIDAPMLSKVFKANLFWLQQETPSVGEIYVVRIGTQEFTARVQSIDARHDRIVELTLGTLTLQPFDEGQNITLVKNNVVAGAGTVSIAGFPDRRPHIQPARNLSIEEHLFTHDQRSIANGHHGGVFWFTGLSGSGKTTLAMAVEKELFERGYKTYVLDGDNIRHGLNADLGFAPADRAENIRRAGHVAALMADAGLVVLTAFISPYRADRDAAKVAAGGHFSKIYLNADLETCENRDPKGLYKKARAGKITGFTGIDSPYETPENADLVVDTGSRSVQECVGQVLAFIEEKVALEPGTHKEKIFAA